MKPTYQGFEAKENSTNFLELPPAGVYIGQIMAVRVVDADGVKTFRDWLEVMLEITEGDYKGRFTAVYNDQKERFGAENTRYRGTFRIAIPTGKEDEEEWVKRNFEGNLWCVEQSNPGYHWDWDENKLTGKKIGINLRTRLYTYNGKDKETVEVARFETIDDVKSGKAKPAKVRDQRKHDDTPSFDTSTFTEVNTELPPWG